MATNTDVKSATAERETQLSSLWRDAYGLGYKHGENASNVRSFNHAEADRRVKMDVARQLSAEGFDGDE